MYSKKFNYCVKKVLEVEGGFVEHPNDRGGPTNFGITLQTFSMFRKHPVGVEDLKELSESEAKAIYHQLFWVPMNLDMVESYLICHMLFDQGVNAGAYAAIKLIQNVLVTEFAVSFATKVGGDTFTVLVQDGILGSKTAQAINVISVHHEQMLAMHYFYAIQILYVEIARIDPTQIVFLKGWIRRSHKFLPLLVG